MTLTYNGSQLRKLSIIAVATAVLLVVGMVYFAGVNRAGAVAPSDYGLKEGNTISAAGSNDPDVYIINDWGYKRLFLNPVIFGFYGHLGGFAKVKTVTPTVRDAFGTSGLFRNCETNDKKVYGIETTGEDTGNLHWVNTTGDAAVAADPNFFKKVFCINTKEFNWYPQAAAYTSVSQVPVYTRAGVLASGTPTPTPASGPVSVTLASDNPGAATITQQATGLVYMKLAFSGSGTVTSLRVVRHGPGATGDFSNLYLYDGANRLTSGRSPSSYDGSVTFSNLNVAVSGTKVLSVVADMASGATAGNVNYISVDKAGDVMLSGGGTGGGSYPINGSNMTISGQVGGKITIDNSGSLGNPNVGQTHAEIAEFKLTANTEGAKVARFQLLNAGTMKSTDITNLSAEVNGVKVGSGVMTSGGYAVFDMSGSPFVIAKGDNRIFKIYADMAGKKSDTINFYLEVTSDLLATGDQFGFGMGVTNNLSTGSSGQTLTLQGGVLTLSFVGPSASNVSTTTTKSHFLDFDVNAATNVELRKHVVVMCKATGGGSTYDNITSTTGGFGDINNIAIINRDTGATLVGPADGSAFTTLSTDANACGTGKGGLQKSFTDTVNLNAGQTLHLAIVGDVKTSNTGGTELVSGDGFKAVIYGYGTQAGSSGDLTIARYTNTNTALTTSDIVPAGNITGNGQTVQGSSLTLALAANPATGNHNFVVGTSGITANGFSFTAALGSPITVTNVTLTGYIADSGTTLAKGVGAAPDGNLNVGALVNATRLVDGDTGQVVASGPTTNNLSNSTGTAQFTNLSWSIPSGATKTLLVQNDLSTNPTSGSSDVYSFDIAATTDVTAIDQNSNTVNAANAAVNGTTAPTTYVTVNSSGTLASALAADAATSAPVYWGQQGAAFSKFKFTSTNEGFFVQRLNLYTADTAADLVNNIDSVTVSYTNKAGNTMTATGTFNSSASVSFSFADPAPGAPVSSDVRPYVPKDNVLYVTVTANVKTAAALFRATNKNFSIDLSAVHDDEFRAVGEGSGVVKQGTNITTTAGNNMYVYRSYPQFSFIGTPATTIAVGQDVFKFSINATGLSSDGATVFFDGNTAAASGSMKFAVIASGENGNALNFDLRRVVDSSGAGVDQLVATSGSVSPGSGATAASASFTFGSGGNQSINIPAGSSNTFVLRLNTVTGFANPGTNTGRAADFLQVIMRNNEASLIKWTDNGGTDRDASPPSTANILKTLPMYGLRISFH